MELIFGLIFLPVVFIVAAPLERAHYRKIVEREAALLHLPTRAEFDQDEVCAPFPTDLINPDAKLVGGSVVITTDYFKRFLGDLISIFGGNISAYESVMDRSRREAILRMKEEAKSWGAEEIWGVRIATSSVRRGAVEVVAYGTALRGSSFRAT